MIIYYNMDFFGVIMCSSQILLYVFLFFLSLYYAGVGQSCVHLCIMCAVSYHGIALDGENPVGRSNKMRPDILQYNGSAPCDLVGLCCIAKDKYFID